MDLQRFGFAERERLSPVVREWRKGKRKGIEYEQNMRNRIWRKGKRIEIEQNRNRI